VSSVAARSILPDPCHEAHYQPSRPILVAAQAVLKAVNVRSKSLYSKDGKHLAAFTYRRIKVYAGAMTPGSYAVFAQLEPVDGLARGAEFDAGGKAPWNHVSSDGRVPYSADYPDVGDATLGPRGTLLGFGMMAPNEKAFDIW
jgi:hypothetical protein